MMAEALDRTGKKTAVNVNAGNGARAKLLQTTPLIFTLTGLTHNDLHSASFMKRLIHDHYTKSH